MRTVGIYLGDYYNPYDEIDVQNGIGGSETWGFEVSKILSRYYKVTLYAKPREDHNINDNLELVNYQEYYEDIKKGREFDYFIFSRETDLISPYLKCPNVYVMIHDVVCKSNYHIGLGRVKGYGYLSEWQGCNIMNQHPGLTRNLLKKVTNGFSKELYDKYIHLEKTNSMVWSSSLVRGIFDIYDYALSDIIQAFPDFTIHVCCGTIYDQDRELLERAKGLKNVVVHGRLSKDELAKLQCQAKLWIYPGTFPETFCITAVENAYAGNLLIMPGSYGLSTTFGGYKGFEKFGYTPFTQKDKFKILDMAMATLSRHIGIDSYIESSIRIASQYSWERAAQEWVDIFNHSDEVIL